MQILIFLFSFLFTSFSFNFLHASKLPHGLVLMIPDGTGPAVMTLARAFQDPTGEKNLNLDSLLRGSVRTYSSDNLVTDSASSATAYSTGQKTYNGAIALNEKKEKLMTIMEAAKAKGMLTGVIVTSRVTHATPASFLSHVEHRDLEKDIATQIVYDQEPDFVLGGGHKYFNDSMIQQIQTNGYTFIQNKKELMKYSKDFCGTRQIKLFGLFARSHMAYELDRNQTEQPSLKEMVSTVLNMVEQNPKAQKNGFMIMIEGSRVDHAGHDNDPATMAVEALMFDQTVQVVKKFVEKSKRNRAMISVADHETGGLSLGRQNETAVESIFDCPEGNCNKYKKLFPYVYLPQVLQKQKKSAEYVSGQLVEELTDCLNTKTQTKEKCLSVSMDSTKAAVKELSAINKLSTEELNYIETTLKKIANGDDSYDYELLHAIAHATSLRAYIGWSTGGHSGVDVGLYCYGPLTFEQKCYGVHQNTHVFEIIRQYLGIEKALLNRKN